MSCRQPKPCDCRKCIKHNEEVRRQNQERKELISNAKNATLGNSKEHIFDLLKKLINETH